MPGSNPATLARLRLMHPERAAERHAVLSELVAEMEMLDSLRTKCNRRLGAMLRERRKACGLKPQNFAARLGVPTEVLEHLEFGHEFQGGRWTPTLARLYAQACEQNTHPKNYNTEVAG